VEVAEAVSAVGCVMLNVCESVQPAGDETVHVYVPAQSADAVAPVPPDGAQAYVYVPVPPPATTVADPLQAALQVTFTCDGVIVIAGGAVIATVAELRQPFASVTVAV
jgi:hypothetical protein